MHREIRITTHAIERWQQRVDPATSWLAGHLAIRKLLNTGRSAANSPALDAPTGRTRHDVRLQRLFQGSARS
jgi:hypothetical protein